MNVAALPRTFVAVEVGRYQLTVESIGIALSVDRLRRERHELMGELTVRCAVPGAQTFDGTLSAADFNLSSARARTDRAKLLRARSNAHDLDWEGYVEELCQRVIAAERIGQPAIDLRTAACPPPDDTLRVLGLHLPRRHPAVLFGDGGSTKSLVALYAAGQLAAGGVRVGFFDWELAPEDHRLRLGQLFGDDMPEVRYVRCERPLVHDVDRLRRVVRDLALDYCIFDSVAFACAGPPESAESAGAYYLAVRQIGVRGSLHIAHKTKNEDGDKTPFGSIFWHNGARATWFIRRDDASGSDVSLLVQSRKANLGPLRPPIGLRASFEGGRIRIVRADPATVTEFAARLPMAQRLTSALSGGPRPIHDLARELDAKTDTVEKALKRNEGRLFSRRDGRDGVTIWTNCAGGADTCPSDTPDTCPPAHTGHLSAGQTGHLSDG